MYVETLVKPWWAALLFACFIITNYLYL